MSENISNPVYNHPPVQEAVFDLQTRGGRVFNTELFKSFPERNQHYTLQGFLQNVNVDTKNNTSTAEIVGCRYVSKDTKQIVLFKNSGFSYSRLKIYDGWEKNYKEALKLWNIYCEITKPEVITRVATRFINQFHITPLFTKPEEYFNTYIKYDHNISSAWDNMFCRLLVCHNEGIKSNIIFDSRVNKDNQNVGVIFDIDAYADDLNLLKTNLKSMEEIFNRLRKIKNNIFEKSITNKTRELIK